MIGRHALRPAATLPDRPVMVFHGGAVVSFVARALVASGLFVALLLAPLVVAALLDPITAARPFGVELSVAFGFVAFALIACESALVARLQFANAAFGTDSLMQVHRVLGIAALGFVVGHALLPVARWGAGLLDPLSGPWAARAGAAGGWLLLVLIAAAVLRRRMPISYEAWRVAHGVLALVVIVLSVFHAVAIEGQSYTDVAAVRWLLLGYAALSIALLGGYRLLRPLVLWRRPWRLVENRDVGGDTRVLVVRPDGHEGLRFAPGQFVWVTTRGTPLGVHDHPISIASSSDAPPEAGIELAIKAAGDWSGEEVPQLAPGARVWIDGPYGAFTLDRVPAQQVVLIAGGIGVAPMRSMLLSMRDRGDRRPVLLVHAAHDRTRMVFADELGRLAGAIDLTCVAVLEDDEQAPSGWALERGLVTEDVLRRHLPPRSDMAQYFVCGPAPMMTATEQVLARLGVPPERIQSERFDMV